MTVSHIYDFHIFTVIYLPLYRFIWNQHNDQLPVALLAQFVERHWFKSRTGMNFFGPYFTTVSIVFISAKIASIFITLSLLLTVSELSNLRWNIFCHQIYIMKCIKNFKWKSLCYSRKIVYEHTNACTVYLKKNTPFERIRHFYIPGVHHMWGESVVVRKSFSDQGVGSKEQLFMK